ncbi:hypothetical protein GF340_03905 [Candidatus Peregrinibacteria bacterium]|nr:hypothetical protein [Candidatus Peregrinibacteria bacterium]
MESEKFNNRQAIKDLFLEWGPIIEEMCKGMDEMCKGMDDIVKPSEQYCAEDPNHRHK